MIRGAWQRMLGWYIDFIKVLESVLTIWRFWSGVVWNRLGLHMLETHNLNHFIARFPHKWDLHNLVITVSADTLSPNSLWLPPCTMLITNSHVKYIMLSAISNMLSLMRRYYSKWLTRCHKMSRYFETGFPNDLYFLERFYFWSWVLEKSFDLKIRIRKSWKVLIFGKSRLMNWSWIYVS